MKSIAFINNKGSVEKTSLVYHLAWMYAELGVNVVAADLDPQANLTRMFVDDSRLEALWTEGHKRRTIYGAIQPLLEGTGDVTVPHVEHPTPGLGLVMGDLALSAAEEEFANQWRNCLDRKPRGLRVLSALWRVLRLAAEQIAADVVLVDVGPNLGALNRAALVAVDDVVTPLAPDPHSLQGLHNLGPTLRRWREEWNERRGRNPAAALDVPAGTIRPIGYVVMQHAAVRLDRSVKAYTHWMARIPDAYAESVVGDHSQPGRTIDSDPHCLATLKHFRSLMPLAQEARKPMFNLKPADGAMGGYANAVADCRADFVVLARAVAERAGMGPPRRRV